MPPRLKLPSLASVAALAVVCTTASLGAWQLQRAGEKATAQAARDAALAAPPLRIGPDTAGTPVSDDRRVELVGRFEPGGTLFLDNRTHRGVAGFHVLTPMRPDGGGPVVMVLRGWVGRELRDRTRPLAFDTPGGTVRIEGLAVRELAQPMLLAEPAPTDGPLLQRFDLDAWRRARGGTAAPFVVRQTSSLDDGLVREWVQPGASVDRHHGYAAQWFTMSVLAALVWWRLAALHRRGRARGGSVSGPGGGMP